MDKRKKPRIISESKRKKIKKKIKSPKISNENGFELAQRLE
jgi:hypothetical protein